MKHELWTVADHAATHAPADQRTCPICDWGLDICKNCNRAEIELTREPDCDGFKGHRTLEVTEVEQ